MTAAPAKNTTIAGSFSAIDASRSATVFVTCVPRAFSSFNFPIVEISS